MEEALLKTAVRCENQLGLPPAIVNTIRETARTATEREAARDLAKQMFSVFADDVDFWCDVVFSVSGTFQEKIEADVRYDVEVAPRNEDIQGIRNASDQSDWGSTRGKSYEEYFENDFARVPRNGFRATGDAGGPADDPGWLRRSQKDGDDGDVTGEDEEIDE